MLDTGNENQKQTILIADDSRMNINIIVEIFKNDYEIIIARDGRQALKRVASDPPDLILLDIIMPEMDGYEVCRRLKADAETKDIPVVFLTSLSNNDEESKGLTLGAIDYIKKPMKIPIVKARVCNLMRLRAAMVELESLRKLALDANPNTGLPGNNSVNKIITAALQNNDASCVIYADLDNFKAFNDKYGFARGDAVIQFTASVLKEALKTNGCDDAFTGHIGGDDFVLLVPSEKSNDVAETIKNRFDQEITAFYNSEDTLAQCIRTSDRQGRPKTFPLMSISMAGVDLANRKFSQYLQVNDACTEIKKKAKEVAGSCFISDMRIDTA
ncbi:response regulator [Desulfococcaceae bacterium HSG9]|nr:response regulator [Desulfococcaceae bacterium HSG9]